MNVRCELAVNGGERRILLVAKDEETPEHVAMRLAAAALFFDGEPLLEVGAKHPAAEEFGFFPDLLVLNPDGSPKTWVECGNTAMNKLSKVARRLKGGARLVIMRETPDAGERVRAAVDAEIREKDKVDVLAWPPGEFARWTAAVKESSHVSGEAGGVGLNLVLNEEVFCVDLLKY